jgi:ADP-ribosyl-[dinitrogen reductase] hydrolase
VPSELARIFAPRRIFEIGKSTSNFLAAIRGGSCWLEASQHLAGNGAITRMPAVIVPHLRGGGADLTADAVLATAVTHNDRAAIGASVAFAGMLADLLTMDAPAEDAWWIRRCVEIARELEGDNRIAPRGGPFRDRWSGPLWKFVEQYVPEHVNQTVVEATGVWYSGAYLLETIPTGLHILIRHGRNPEEAIVRATNDTKDNDSIASLVGAAMGALHGLKRLPDRWKSGLLGRTAEDDDGRVFELLDAAISRLGLSSVISIPPGMRPSHS